MKERGEIYVVDSTSTPAESDLPKSKVDLDGIVVELDPREEWAQIFHEGWRTMRDFYWDPGLGGMDWVAERERYGGLLPRLASRADLQDLLGELIGELNTSHTYVFGGDPGVDVPQVATGLLGAQFTRRGDAFEIARLYRADPADGVRSPLAGPGAGLKEGDHLLAINQRPFTGDRPLEAHLAGLAGKEVVLTVNAQPKHEGARDVVVRTLQPHEHRELLYSDWVRRNREYVAQRTEGKIGYIHIPDMWKDGLIQFNTWFYPQLDREGMVVDVRWNGGGAVSQMILERFKRRLLSFDRARGGGVSTYPSRVLNGPFVVLTNESAGSDGDIFPMAIQLEKLAPVIGMRSWGGVVGIRLNKLLVDGGILTQPEFAWWDPQQGWELENRGVIPDIELQNLPQDLAKGKDAQLDRAIEEVLRLHGEQPPVRPAFGPVRVRTREAFREREP
jgi:tricorn protease